MIDFIKAGVIRLAIITIFAFAAVMPIPEASAEETGTFTGTWVANGQRQPFEFVAGREVGTFYLAGNVNL